MSLADPKLAGLADTDDVALEFHPWPTSSR